METKVCKVCERELPLTEFRMTKGGIRQNTCTSCVNEKRAQTRYDRAQMGGVKPLPFQMSCLTANNPWRSFSS